MKKQYLSWHTAGIVLLFFLLAACSGAVPGHTQKATVHPELKKLWETDTLLRVPESVLWDSGQQLFYVSSINGRPDAKDGNGFISILKPDGKLSNLHWITGLNAPKGMGKYKAKLFVADLDRLVVIDITKHEIGQKIQVPGATFLNDITIDDNGKVYLSDSREGKIFEYKNGEVSVYLSNPEIKGANGLWLRDHKLWINTKSGIYAYDLLNQKFSLFCESVKGGDGLTAAAGNNWMASQWKGAVYYVHADGTAEKILDTQPDKLNAADIYYLKNRKLLVIPTFNGNKITAYYFDDNINKNAFSPN